MRRGPLGSEDGALNCMLSGGYFETSELREMGFAAVGNEVRVSKRVEIPDPSRIWLGSHVRIDAFVTITIGSSGFVRVGSYTHIADRVRLVGSDGIVVGNYVGLASNVNILSMSDDYSGSYLVGPMAPLRTTGGTRGRVDLGDHVVVGASSIIFPGISLGEGVAVGACSLVNRSLPSWGIYFGAPVRFVKKRSKDMLKFLDEDELMGLQ